MKKQIDPTQDIHYVHKSNWLRAAVLGANDGILSTASIAIGVAAASDLREPVLLATLAGLLAGALSMAAGEYVSVSSQSDIEKADIEREKRELEEFPEIELQRITEIYLQRGLKKETALTVAKELTENDALGAHVRDELGINQMSHANPFQAAMASSLSFAVGGMLPFLVTLLLPLDRMEYYLYGFSIVFLMILGAIAAKTGGFNISRAMLRITFWGTVAMAVTAFAGYLFGARMG
jgi:VIT1/CCC1 family predicted Fe2+/Mn2+ transporter